MADVLQNYLLAETETDSRIITFRALNGTQDLLDTNQ